MIKVLFTLYFEKADLRVRGYFEFLCELFVEVRPRRASGLAVCSCGNKRGTRESKEFKCELAL